MKYIVQISETLSRMVEIEASNPAKAMQIVEDKYYDGDIVLNADDYVDGSVQIDIVGKGDYYGNN